LWVAQFAKLQVWRRAALASFFKTNELIPGTTTGQKLSTLPFERAQVGRPVVVTALGVNTITFLALSLQSNGTLTYTSILSLCGIGFAGIAVVYETLAIREEKKSRNLSVTTIENLSRSEGCPPYDVVDLEKQLAQSTHSYSRTHYLITTLLSVLLWVIVMCFFILS